MLQRTLLCVSGLAISAALFSSTAKAAQAAHLYWGSTAVGTASTRTCYDFAYTAMRSLDFQDIRRSQSEVAGSRGGSYAAITCLGSSPRATALVMVVGDDGGETARMRDILRRRIAGTTLFD